MANIDKDSEFPSMIVPYVEVNDQDYFQHSEYLNRSKHFSYPGIAAKLMRIDVNYGLLYLHIITNTRQYPKSTFLEAIQINIDPRNMNIGVGHNVIRQCIKDFIHFGLLLRATPRGFTYYVNPLMSHYLTTAQRNEYGDNYSNMFPPIVI